MSWSEQSIVGPELGGVVIDNPETHTRIRPADVDPAKDWLCAWCLNRVANEKDRSSHSGQSEFSFKNPQGIPFDIITFTQAVGCRQAGVATLQHTWFAGYAWSYSLCDQCGMHLGWFYDGPNTFVGLIRDRIVLASLALN